MKKVYVVTDGDYSDYHIEAIFTNRKDAVIYQRIMQSQKIETWEIDKFDFAKHKDENCWRVKFAENGKVVCATQSDGVFRDGLRESTIEVYGTYHKKYYKDSDAGCWVWAKDEQSAVKIASEYRTILLGSHPEAVELARQSEDSKAFIISNGEIKEMEYK